MAENRAPKAPAREFGDRGMKQRHSRRKVCAFCADKVEALITRMQPVSESSFPSVVRSCRSV